MTCLALKPGFDVFHESPALSDSKKRIGLQQLIESSSRSIALDIEPQVRRHKFLNELRGAVAEAALNGWAGLGSRRADMSAVAMASVLIDLLPPGVPAPEVSISPNGEVVLDWERGASRLFSIALKGDDKLAFASYNRGERLSGALEFHSDALPGEVVRQLFSWLAK